MTGRHAAVEGPQAAAHADALYMDQRVAAEADRVGRSAPTPGSVREGQGVLIAETSNSRVILSLTKTPPVSSAAFQVMP